MSRLDEIKKRLAAATPGEWRDWIHRTTLEMPEGKRKSVVFGHGPSNLTDEPNGVSRAVADADLIAHAPSDLTWLISENERLRHGDSKSRFGEMVDSLYRVEQLRTQRDEALRRARGLEAALKFYADGDHFEWCGRYDYEPEPASGEPENWLCGGAKNGEFQYEDGTVAAKALAEFGESTEKGGERSCTCGTAVDWAHEPGCEKGGER